MKKWKYAVGIMLCCIAMAGCSKDDQETLSSTATVKNKTGSISVPEEMASSSPPESRNSLNENSAAVTKSNVYDKTYVYNDHEFNSKAVIFRILKLETKKTYEVSADEERMHLLDVVWKYFDDLARQEGLSEEEYYLDDLEYVYELKDQLLYMPVYFKYNSEETGKKEKLYNLVVRETEGAFELIGQTDRALLNEEQYPKERILKEEDVEEKEPSFTMNKVLYNNYWTNGTRIKQPAIRTAFLKKMEDHIKSTLSQEDDRWEVRIGVADVVQNEQRDYFALMEVVYYDGTHLEKQVKRYQVINTAGTLETFEFYPLGVYDNIIDISPEDYRILSCRKLYEEAVQEEIDFINDKEEEFESQ